MNKGQCGPEVRKCVKKFERLTEGPSGLILFDFYEGTGLIVWIRKWKEFPSHLLLMFTPWSHLGQVGVVRCQESHQKVQATKVPGYEYSVDQCVNVSGCIL